MQAFPLAPFLARSTDRALSDTDLGKLLPHLGLTPNGPWLGGGALRRTLLGEDVPSDIDMFFAGAEQLKWFVQYLQTSGFEKVRETEHHAHYRGSFDGDRVRDIQCIRFAYYQDAAAVIDSFDFTVCQFAFDGEQLTCGEHALWDLGRKRLALHKLTYPVATMRRMIKYSQQGFYACPGCMSAILTATVDSPALREQMSITYVD